jgi:hypothetical protein
MGHGASILSSDWNETSGTVAIDAVAPQPVVIYEPKQLLKLDLGCGQTPKEGFEGVDRYAADAAHKIDLFKFPWPWADNSVEALHCSHFLEHIPAREVEERDLRAGADRERWLDQDMLCAFMDECWRVLQHEGTLQVVVPCGRSNRGFQDPTHRRFFVEESFAYFWKEWRDANKLDHYLFRGGCNFVCNVIPGVPEEIALRSAEAQGNAIRKDWNAVADWHVTMKAIKK